MPEFSEFDPDDPIPESIIAGQNFNIRKGSAIKRGGLTLFHATTPGGKIVSDCEEAGWTNSATDTEKFLEGTGSQKWINTPADTQSEDCVLIKSVAMNGSGTDTDLIQMWLYTTDDIGSGDPHLGDVDIKFEDSPGNHFEHLIYLAEADVVSGWQLISAPKSAFAITGAPSWGGIDEITVTLRRHTGIMPAGTTVIVYFDAIALNRGTPIENIIEYTQKGGTQKFLVKSGVAIWESTSSHTIWTNLIAGFTPGLRLGWTVFNDHLIVGDGSNDNVKYRTAESNVGLTAPIAAATFNARLDGAMIVGTYHYRYVFLNSTTGHYGNPSPASLPMAPAADPNDGIRIDVPDEPAADAQIDEIIVYRTLLNSPVNSRYYRIPGIHAFTPGGGAITVDDITPDSELLGEEIEYDNNIPPKFTSAVQDGNYVYYIGDPNFKSRVWRSKFGRSESVPPLSFTDCGPDDGDVLRAIGITNGGRVVAFKMDSKYQINDLGRGLLGHRRINSRGTFNSESVRSTPGGLVYLNTDSIYIYENADINIGENVRSVVRGLIAASAVESIVGFDRFDNTIMVGIVPPGSTGITQELVYDIKERIWANHTEDYTAVGEWVIANQPVNLVGDSAGQLYAHDGTSANDRGIPVDAWVQTPFETGGHPDRLKKFRTIILWLSPTGNYNLELNFIRNYGTSIGTTVLVPLTTGSSLWGTMVWGVDKWGGQSTIRIEIPIPLQDRVSHALSAKISNNGFNESFIVYGYQFLWQVMGRSS